MWHWILAALASISAGPDALEREAPKAAAAVAVAYGSLGTPEPRATDRPDVAGVTPGTVPPSVDRECRDCRTGNAGSKALPSGVTAGGSRK